MDDKPKHRPHREAKKKTTKAIDTSSIVNPGTKKRSAKKARKKTFSIHVDEGIDTGSIANPGTKKRSAPTYEHSGRAQKVRKKTHVDQDAENISPLLPSTPSSTPSRHVDEDAENTSLLITPGTKRMASHAGLIEKGTVVYTQDMETQIAAEARGVTRKNIPLDKFRSKYLRDFRAKAQLKLAVNSVKEIGEGHWEEKQFWDRLRQSLSDEVCCSGRFHMSLSPLLTY